MHQIRIFVSDSKGASQKRRLWWAIDNKILNTVDIVLSFDYYCIVKMSSFRKMYKSLVIIFIALKLVGSAHVHCTQLISFGKCYLPEW